MWRKDWYPFLSLRSRHRQSSPRKLSCITVQSARSITGHHKIRGQPVYFLFGWPWSLTMNRQRNNLKTVKENSIRIPDTTACKICTNNWNDFCEDCLDDGFKNFNLKPGLTLEDLPRFPTKEFTNGLPVSIRQILVAIYLEKIIDFLNGW
jgi:hypothetical protein